MKKNKIIVFITTFLMIFTFSFINVHAEEKSIYDVFVENISKASDVHYDMTQDNLILDNSYSELYGILSSSNNQLYLNFLFVQKNSDAYFKINYNDKSKIYHVDGYGIIYGFNVNKDYEVSVSVFINDKEVQNIDLSNYTNADYIETLNKTTTGGTDKYPANIYDKVHLSSKDLILLFQIGGLFVIVILVIVIFVIINKKKVNIKSDMVDQMNAFNDQFNNMNNPNNNPNLNNTDPNIIDSTYTMDEVKPVDAVKDEPEEIKYDKDFLVELYRKKYANQITEKEFDIAFRKYMDAKTRDDEDD